MPWPSTYLRGLFGLEAWLILSTGLVAQPVPHASATVETASRPQALVFLPPTDDLLVVGDDGSVLLVDRRVGTVESRTIWQDRGKPRLIAVSRSAPEIAFYTREQGIVMVSRADFARTRPLATGELPELTSLDFGDDGNSLIGRTATNQVIRWSTDDGATITSQQLTDFVGPVAIAPDADFAVGEHGPDGLVVWDLATNSLQRPLESADGGASAVAISPSGRLIAGAPTLNQEKVNVWDAASGQLLLVLDVPGDRKRVLQFAADDQLLTVVDASGLVSVWEVPFKLPLGSFQLPAGVGQPYTVNSDGSRVATSADKSVTISPIESEYPRPERSEPAHPTFIISAPMEHHVDTSVEPDEPRIAEEQPAEEPTAEAPAEEAPAEEAPAEEAPAEEAPAEEAPAAEEPAAEEPTEEESAEEAPDEEAADEGPTGEMRRDDHTAAPVLDSAEPEEEEPAAPGASAKKITDVPVLFGTNRARDRGVTWRAYFAGFFFTWLSCVVYALFIVAVMVGGLAFGKRAARWTAIAFAILLLALGAIYAQVKTSERFQMVGDEFGGRLDESEIHYGRCVVTIPPEHKEGLLESPLGVWVFRGRENPQTHVTIREFLELDAASFSEQLRAEMASTNSQDVMVFIHGYNVSFRDAIRRTAQLTFDLEFPGPGICFSWPSHADPVRYMFDASNADSSIGALRDFLNYVAHTNGVGRVHVIAHSMGNRVLAGALPLIDAAAKERIGYVVLAAPDIHHPQFLDPIARTIAALNYRATLYVSSHDRALQISKCFNNVQRAGERDPELTLCDGFETIDASAVDTSLLGHSYYGDIPSVIDDLKKLIRENKLAAERLANSASQVGNRTFWRLNP